MRLDAGANETTVAKAGRISHPDSKIEVWVIPVDEQQILAQEALAVISPSMKRMTKGEQG